MFFSEKMILDHTDYFCDKIFVFFFFFVFFFVFFWYLIFYIVNMQNDSVLVTIDRFFCITMVIWVDLKTYTM